MKLISDLSARLREAAAPLTQAIEAAQTSWSGLRSRKPDNLAEQQIQGAEGGAIAFEIDPFRKHCLLNGLDDIGLTLEKADKIDAYEKSVAQSRPWA